jgi:DNA-binding CsgD family transcriptional regulator
VNDAAKTKDIALKLGLSGHTIERYMETLLAKKGVSTQKELIVKHYKEILNEVTYGKN